METFIRRVANSFQELFHSRHFVTGEPNASPMTADGAMDGWTWRLLLGAAYKFVTFCDARLLAHRDLWECRVVVSRGVEEIVVRVLISHSYRGSRIRANDKDVNNQTSNQTHPKLFVISAEIKENF